MTLLDDFFKPHDIKCLILALEQSSTNNADVKEMWCEIEGECDMIARVTPREIGDDGFTNLKEAKFEEK